MLVTGRERVGVLPGKGAFFVAGGMCPEKVQVKCGGGVLHVLRACLRQQAGE